MLATVETSTPGDGGRTGGLTLISARLTNEPRIKPTTTAALFLRIVVIGML